MRQSDSIAGKLATSVLSCEQKGDSQRKATSRSAQNNLPLELSDYTQLFPDVVKVKFWERKFLGPGHPREHTNAKPKEQNPMLTSSARSKEDSRNWTKLSIGLS